MKCEHCEFDAKSKAGLSAHTRKIHTEKEASVPMDEPPKATNPNEAILKRIADLEKKDQENQKTIQMLRDVADKGRVFSWESKQKKDRQPLRVKLSVIDGKYLVGWRTVKDELITDPRTGATVGENQQYEILLSDNANTLTTKIVNGYLNFSNLRYDERVDVQVISRSETFDGKTNFEVLLPHGEKLVLDSRFVN